MIREFSVQVVLLHDSVNIDNEMGANVAQGWILVSPNDRQ